MAMIGVLRGSSGEEEVCQKKPHIEPKEDD